MKRLLNLFLFLLIHSLANSQTPNYSHYNHKKGLLSPGVWCLKQKDDGGLLLGTQGEGLIEFDGKFFKSLIKKESSPYSNFFITDFLSINEKVYFSDKYKGVFSLDKYGKIKQVTEKKDNGEIYKLIEYRKNIFVVHQHGIYKLNLTDSKQKTIFNAHTEKTFEVFQLIKTPTGIIILSNQGNYQLTNESCQLLSQNIEKNKQKIDSARFGFFESNELHLFSRELDVENIFSISSKNKITLKNSRKLSTSSNPNQTITTHFNKQKQCFSYVTNEGLIFELINTKWKSIPFNYKENINHVISFTADYNGDYWFGSNTDGLFKVSFEPFTKLEFHHAMMNRNIIFTKQLSSGKLMFSTRDNNTFVGYLNEKNISHFKIKVLSASYYKNELYCGTNLGLKIFNENTGVFTDVKLPFLKNIATQLVYCDSNNMWISQENNGLIKYNLSTKEHLIYNDKNKLNSDYSYCAMLSKDQKNIYIGGNNGIFKYSKSTNNVTKIKTDNMGSYYGNVTIDIYGTIWFTAEEGLIGIKKNNEIKKIDTTPYFSSKLFFTLTSDANGNLIIGTNHGIHTLLINENCKILRSKNYTIKNGYQGYESNMRSASQNGNILIFGTIEGLFLLNSAFLTPKSIAKNPQIKIINPELNSGLGRLNFSFYNKNKKEAPIYYSYRIKEISNKWTKFSEEKTYLLQGLKSNTYTIQVRSSYDGIKHGNTTEKTVTIESPIYKSFWFILPLLLLLFFILLFLTMDNGYKSVATTSSENHLFPQTLIPNLILFGLFTNCSSEILIFIYSDEIIIQPYFILTLFLLLISIYLMSRYFEKKNIYNGLRFSLTISYLLIILFNLTRVYQTDLHPYYALAVLAVTLTAPFIFNKFKWVAIYSFIFTTICFFISYVIDSPIFNGYLFILACIFISLLTTTIGYSYFSTLKKLSLISTIIDNTSAINIAFDQNNTIQFISANINQYINATTDELQNTLLNNMLKFVNQNELNEPLIDLTNLHLNTKKRHLIPFNGKNGNTIWFSFDYATSNSNLTVICLTDVTEKINIKSTNDILLELAEDLIFKIDEFGHFQYLNEKFKTKLGYVPSDLIGSKATSIVDESHKQVVINFYDDHIKNKLKFSYFEFPIISKNGTMVWVGQHLSTIFKSNDKEKIDGFIAVSRDITIKKKQDNLIQTQKEDIENSVDFVKQIQQNFLLTNSDFENLFNDSFILFKPKNDVSSDFYWSKKLGDTTLIVLGDSGENGIKGGVISIILNGILNSLTTDYELSDPGVLLTEIDKLLTNQIQNIISNKNHSIGVTLSICSLNNITNTLNYATAGGVVLVHDGENFNMYKGENHIIGSKSRSAAFGYLTNKIQLNNQSIVYLFSDGFQNQIGTIKEQSYSFKRFVELLSMNVRLPLKDQKTMFWDEFNQWKLNEEQTEDITIIAFKPNTFSSTI